MCEVSGPPYGVLGMKKRCRTNKCVLLKLLRELLPGLSPGPGRLEPEPLYAHDNYNWLISSMNLQVGV